jgi:putative transposase
VAYDNRPVQYLQATPVAGHIQTRLYQVQLLHKEFAQPLHVVSSAKMHLQTQAGAHVIRFSRELELGYAPLVDD